jgi:hypothetical protein
MLDSEVALSSAEDTDPSHLGPRQVFDQPKLGKSKTGGLMRGLEGGGQLLHEELGMITGRIERRECRTIAIQDLTGLRVRTKGPECQPDRV